MNNRIEQQLRLMISHQNELNTIVHPTWYFQGFEWYRAIWIECAEMMDHLGYKWWKKQNPDMDQSFLELVDIFHFGISSLSEQYSLMNTEIDHQSTYKQFTQFVLNSITHTNVNKNPYDKKNLQSLIEDFASMTISSKLFSISMFTNILYTMGYSFDDLFKFYIGKNMLNVFRQAYGYKTGTYHKEWNGVEDNVVLAEVCNTTKLDDVALFGNVVYEQLEHRYPYSSKYIDNHTENLTKFYND